MSDLIHIMSKVKDAQKITFIFCGKNVKINHFTIVFLEICVIIISVMCKSHNCILETEIRRNMNGTHK